MSLVTDYIEQCPLCKDKGWYPITTWHSGYEKRPCELCISQRTVVKQYGQINDLKVKLRWALSHIDPSYRGKDEGRIKTALAVCKDVNMEFK